MQIAASLERLAGDSDVQLQLRTTAPRCWWRIMAQCGIVNRTHASWISHCWTDFYQLPLLRGLLHGYKWPCLLPALQSWNFAPPSSNDLWCIRLLPHGGERLAYCVTSPRGICISTGNNALISGNGLLTVQRRELRKSVEKVFWKRGLSPVPWNTFSLLGHSANSTWWYFQKKKNQWACFRRWGFWGKEEPSFFIFPHMVFGIPLSPHTFSCPLEKQCHSSLIQPQWDGKRTRVKEHSTLFWISFHAWNIILKHGTEGHLETGSLLQHRDRQANQYFHTSGRLLRTWPN